MILLFIVGFLVLAGLKNAGATAGTANDTPKFLGVPFPTFNFAPHNNLVRAPENNAPPWGTIETHGNAPGAPVIINPVRVDNPTASGGSGGGGGGTIASAPSVPAGGGGGSSSGGAGGTGGGGTGLSGGQRFLNTF